MTGTGAGWAPSATFAGGGGPAGLQACLSLAGLWVPACPAGGCRTVGLGRGRSAVPPTPGHGSRRRCRRAWRGLTPDLGGRAFSPQRVPSGVCHALIEAREQVRPFKPLDPEPLSAPPRPGGPQPFLRRAPRGSNQRARLALPRRLVLSSVASFGAGLVRLSSVEHPTPGPPFSCDRGVPPSPGAPAGSLWVGRRLRAGSSGGCESLGAASLTSLGGWPTRR